MNANDASSDLPLLNAAEARVLGCLIEKKETTPDVYPLTPNAALVAANQKTSRDPIMSLEQVEVHRALATLEQKGLARHTFAARAERYEHRVQQRLGLSQAQIVLLGLLLLRGPQTAYELLARGERMAKFELADEVRENLEALNSARTGACSTARSRAWPARRPLCSPALRSGCSCRPVRTIGCDRAGGAGADARGAVGAASSAGRSSPGPEFFVASSKRRRGNLFRRFSRRDHDQSFDRFTAIHANVSHVDRCEREA